MTWLVISANSESNWTAARSDAMRVLFFPGQGVYPQRGGQGSFCRYLAEGLVELGHSIEIVASGEWAEFCRKWDIRLRNGRRQSVTKPDAVHISGPAVRSAIIELAAGRNVLLTHHDHRYICPATTVWTPNGCQLRDSVGPCRYCPNRDVGARARLRTLRFVAPRCCNVAVSSYLLRRLALPNGHAIFNPIRCESSADPVDSQLVAFAGRLVPEKGIDVLLRAVSKVDDVRLEVAGDGPMLPHLRQLADELGITARVRFLGNQTAEAVLDLYRRATVVCVPSLWCEPFGYSAAEALAIGRGLVTSDRGALPELAGDDRAWVCRAGDPDDLAATLRKVLENRDERERRSERALQFVSRELDPRRVAERYASLYAQPRV